MWCYGCFVYGNCHILTAHTERTFPSTSTIFSCRHNGVVVASEEVILLAISSHSSEFYNFHGQSMLLPRWQFNWSATIWLWIIFIKKIRPFSPSTNNSRHQSSGARHTDKSLKKCQRECKNRRIEATKKNDDDFFFCEKNIKKKTSRVYRRMKNEMGKMK